MEGEQLSVEVRRSRRRRTTVTAYRDGDRMVLLIPARFTRAEEREWTRRMSDRLAARERRRRPGEGELMVRAAELSGRFLGGLARPADVSWVTNQRTRWGSCTPADRTIRLSNRLRGMPLWVVDYVLLHELAHLIEHGHGPRFWALLEPYPYTQRAKGFLEGFAAAQDLTAATDDQESEAGESEAGEPEAGEPEAGAPADAAHGPADAENEPATAEDLFALLPDE